ncbi:unnamed protein product [Calicophoron daubneyi]|uniref:Fork-head domain-containing protein n=1 Tax=Calicophoron daubneyi TaxID=300641 RepID=A0AAV2TJE1_CALDB
MSGGGLNTLSERLRKNWMQKLSLDEVPDDSLTNLTWLYDMHPIGLEVESTQRGLDFEFKSGVDYSGRTPIFAKNFSQPFAGSLFDPQVRLDYRTKLTGKPPFSYATLICLAMRELGKPKVTLSDIYGWIMNNFAYYRRTDSSWQNSVRHNLSLNKCFEKVPRDKNERGKGGFWRVNPKHADWLEANLAKCRRAAPPPGPPPPLSRSVLIQQQQSEQYSYENDLVLPCSSMSFCNPLNHVQRSNSETPGHNSLSGADLPIINSVVALSPASASSTSSLSSSPLSFGSSPSPGGYGIAKLSGQTGPANGFNSNPKNCPTTMLPLIDLDRSTGSMSVQMKSSKYMTPTRRRKSPLYNQNSQTEAYMRDLVRVDEMSVKPGENTNLKNNCDNRRIDVKTIYAAKRHLRHTKARIHSASRYKPGWVSGTRQLLCENPNLRTLRFLHKPSTRRYSRFHSNGSSIETRPRRLSDKQAENFHCADERSAGQKTRRRMDEVSTNSRLPTRILPPRHRFSLWSHPQPNCDDTAICQTVCHSNPSSKNKKEQGSPRASLRIAKGEDFRSSSIVCPIIGNDNDCDWPPPSENSKEITFPPVFNPRLCKKTLRSTDLTPPYVPAGLSPYPRTANGDGASSTVSSSSVISSLSGTSSNASDSQMYRTLRMPRHSTPRHVETQACRQLPSFSHTNSRNGAIQFGRLYPTSGEAEAFLGASPDRYKMPKWASVFLPEGEDGDLEPIFERNTRDPQESTNIFSIQNSQTVEEYLTFSDELTSVQAAKSDGRLPGLASCADGISCCSSQLDPSKGIADMLSVQTSTSTSSLLDGLDLDPVDLNFDVLDGLVESSGPIPLDLDFSLTASFSNTQSCISSDSGCSSMDSAAVSFNHSGVPAAWPKEPNSPIVPGIPWFSILDQPISFPSCSDTIETKGKHVENAKQTGRLNTPPSDR